ncbi:hypothetical protein OsI_11956 [Oryza sativa Indica Group]|uniref:Uncharacterized protein n=1 Tax=Oryza sativa subsp. indica TaxID=39946 RepID=B8AQZ4_ORYSI|nr:hypothetical protein OsI_11956 [Oryza sativa Indica Group]
MLDLEPTLTLSEAPPSELNLYVRRCHPSSPLSSSCFRAMLELKHDQLTPFSTGVDTVVVLELKFHGSTSTLGDFSSSL